MNYFKGLFVILFCSMAFISQAQSEKVFLEKYQDGKKLLQQQNYTAAKNLFAELKQEHKNNKWQTYAYYFNALASFEEKKYNEAEQELLALVEKYPQWENIDDVIYLLANIAFERKEDNIALSYTSKIKTIEVMNEANSMKGHYLVKRSIQDLKNLHAVYPDDKFIAQMLVNKIAVKGADLKDVEFAENLVEKYDLEKPAKTRLEKAQKSDNDTIYVAVILPFDVKKVKQQDKPTLTEMSVDLYQAMRIAKRQLDTTGIQIKLVAYDIKNKPDTLRYMHSKGEFNNVRLFVGSFLDDDFEAVLAIAKELNVPAINPVLTNTKFLNHPNAFFLTPSIATQGEQAVAFAKKRFGAKKVAIFYSDLPDDEVFAKAHADEAKKNNVEVVAMQQISTSKLNLIDEVLSQNSDIDYVVVASASQTVASEVLDQMKNKNIAKPVVTYLAWKNFKSVTKEQMEAQQVYFVAPEYLKGEVDSYDFKKAYNIDALQVNKIKNLRKPSIYAYKGYDLMHAFAKSMYIHQGKFMKRLEGNEEFKNTNRGFVFSKEKHDNQFVPMLKYVEGELIIANPSL